MVELPNIEITFKNLATNLIARSERGIAILILKDTKASGKEIELIRNEKEALAVKENYTAENYQRILDCLSFAPYRIYAVKYSEPKTMDNALELISKTVKTGWITTVGETADYQKICEFVENQRIKDRTYKAVVYNHAADNRNVVNFATANVIFADKRGKQKGNEYLPSLAGILAKCNVERGATNFVCANLKEAEESLNLRDEVNAGKLMLTNDFDKVRIALGINSMTTVNADKGQTEDMKYIEIAETMDLISDDIRRTFKEEYQGRYKNSLDYQMIFISAVNTYFKALAVNGILDNEYENKADIDIASQRRAWSLIRPEAEFWDERKVKKTSYKRNVFLAGQIKILNAMESLKFDISLF